MALLDKVIEILDLAEVDARFMLTVVACNRRRVGAARVDGDPFRGATRQCPFARSGRPTAVAGSVGYPIVHLQYMSASIPAMLHLSSVLNPVPVLADNVESIPSACHRW